MAMLAFFGFYAVATILGTFMPSIMAGRGFAITKALQFTLGMTLSYPLSSLFMMWALDHIGRIRTAVGAFIFAGVFSVLFSQSDYNAMILVTGFCMFFFQQLGGNSLTMLTSESFPTNARATGAGLAIGTGRLGAIVSSFGIVALLPYGFRNRRHRRRDRAAHRLTRPSASDFQSRPTSERRPGRLSVDWLRDLSACSM